LNNMLSDFVEKAKGFLMQPTETFQKYKGEELGPALTYYVILVIIFALLTGILALAGISGMFGGLGGLAAGFVGVIVMIIVLIILMLIAAFIDAIFYHLGAKVVGGQKPYNETLKALLYASTPGLLLGWIPIIQIIGYIWSLVLLIIGIREMQEISTGRAIAAIIVGIIIVVIIAVIIGLIVGVAIFSLLAGSGMY